MPNIKPISDLKDYSSVLDEIALGEPLFLTQEGRGRYVILDIAEYERQQAVMELLSELAKGERSILSGGLLSQEEVERELGI